MFDELRHLIEFTWVLAAPALGHHADLALLVLGFALLLTAALATLLISALDGHPIPVEDPGGVRRRLGGRSRSRPPGGPFPRTDAQPRAPGAVLA